VELILRGRAPITGAASSHTARLDTNLAEDGNQDIVDPPDQGHIISPGCERAASRSFRGAELEIFMAVGDFTAFREDLLIAIARGGRGNIGSYIRPKHIADEAGLTYTPGWIREAVRMLADRQFVKATFAIGGGDAGVAATLTGEGWEEAERLAERRGTSLEEPLYVKIEENSPQWVAAQSALDETLSAVKGSNEYAGTEPEDQKQRIAELESGKRLLQAPRGRLEAIKPLLISALRYLATKFADNAIGIAAGAALAAVLALLASISDPKPGWRRAALTHPAPPLHRNYRPPFPTAPATSEPPLTWSTFAAGLGPTLSRASGVSSAT
jgi:hypothetical protein